jgi:hypothetical protein
MVMHGSARLTQDLDIAYSADPTNLDVLGAALQEVHARLRGVPEEVPFVPDGRTLQRTMILTLETDDGPIDLVAQPPGAPPYQELRARATLVEIDGIAVPVASLQDLERMKKAAGRPKDQLDLQELEAIKRLQG